MTFWISNKVACGRSPWRVLRPILSRQSPASAAHFFFYELIMFQGCSSFPSQRHTDTVGKCIDRKILQSIYSYKRLPNRVSPLSLKTRVWQSTTLHAMVQSTITLPCTVWFFFKNVVFVKKKRKNCPKEGKCVTNALFPYSVFLYRTFWWFQLLYKFVLLRY